MGYSPAMEEERPVGKARRVSLRVLIVHKMASRIDEKSCARGGILQQQEAQPPAASSIGQE
jgi:hypothetical protein